MFSCAKNNTLLYYGQYTSGLDTRKSRINTQGMKYAPPYTITLNLLKDHTGLNDTALADAINKKAGKEVIKQNAIWRARTGKTKNPSDDSMKPVADYFGLSALQLRDVDFIKAFISGQRTTKVGELLGILDQLDPQNQDLILEYARTVKKLTSRSDD